MKTALALLACLLSAGPVRAEGTYHLVHQYLLGGDGGWDYLALDAEARRLYIARSTHVMVVDADSGALVGDVPGTDGVHGVALVPSQGWGFASDGKSHAVTVFDLKTLAPIKTVQSTGKNPDAILYDPDSEFVLAFNGRTKNATAFGAKNAKAAGTLPLDGKPEFAVTDGSGGVYVNIEDKSELASLDARTLRVKATYKLAPCEEPSGLALDAQRGLLFAGCHNGMMAVVDARTGVVVSTVPIGQGVDANAFDPGTGLAFASCGDGTLTVAKEAAPGRWEAAQVVATRKGARTMALDPKTHRVYLVTAEFGQAPKPAKDQPYPRPTILPGTFTLLVYGM